MPNITHHIRFRDSEHILYVTDYAWNSGSAIRVVGYFPGSKPTGYIIPWSNISMMVEHAKTED